MTMMTITKIVKDELEGIKNGRVITTSKYSKKSVIRVSTRKKNGC
jgi:hypothetical protein